ncbi:MAG: PilC/PilY family type IV pilus protein [Arenicellales bacterium]|jgi:Tfp pilus tip-associated adhesin PilY1|nr:PilC/PilY family type IV pilus protein [Arenicellales bacterium]
MTFELLRNAFQGRILLALLFLFVFSNSAFAGFEFTNEEFKDGQWHQTGTQTWPDGKKYVGEFRDKKFHGNGELSDCETKSSPEKRVGEFRDGLIWNGKAYDCKDGSVIAVYSRGGRQSPFVKPPPKADDGPIMLPPIVTSHYLGEVSEERPVSEILKEALKLRGEEKYKHYPSVPTAARAGSHVAFKYDSKGNPSRAYVASSHPDKLSGDLWALSMDADGKVSSAPVWKAQAELSSIVPAKRVMLTWNAQSRKGIPFRWTDLSIGQRRDLRTLRWQYYNDPIKADLKTELIDGTCPADIIIPNPNWPGRPNKITFTCGLVGDAYPGGTCLADILGTSKKSIGCAPAWNSFGFAYHYWYFCNGAGRCSVTKGSVRYTCNIYLGTWMPTSSTFDWYHRERWVSQQKVFVSHEVGHCVPIQEALPKVLKALESINDEPRATFGSIVGKTMNSVIAAAYGASHDFDVRNGHSVKEYPSMYTDEAVGRARLMYMRGEKTYEGTRDWKNLKLNTEELNFPDRLSHHTFQQRDPAGVLGEFGHSAPVVVGAPYLGSSADYRAFSNKVKSRPTVVYAGSNDGLLHGFDADTGKELLAYLPASLNGRGLTGGWHSLSDPNEARKTYVDGTPAVFDVKLTGSRKGWRTLLFGSLNRGGRGIFALDVTDPKSFSEKNAKDIVLWEFMGCHKQGCSTSQGAVHNADDPHMGYSFSQPVAAQMNNGDSMVIFGNGDTVDNPRTLFADKDSGKAQLFIASISGGMGGPWAQNKNYWRIPVGEVHHYRQYTASGMQVVTQKNGLSSASAVDVDGNGTADRIYAGDLYGNLWVFDVSSSNPANWGIAPEFKGKPLWVGRARAGPYHPTNRTGEGQPITVRPSIIRHPTIKDAKQPNLMVLFGTGIYREESEYEQGYRQSFYGVWDRGRGALQRRHLVPQTFLLTNKKARVTDPHLKVDYVSGRSGGVGGDYGWYIDLPGPLDSRLPVLGGGQERVIYRSLVRDNLVYFNTLVPVWLDVYREKRSNLSSGWEMVVKTVNGGSPDDAAFDIDGDGKLSAKDAFTGVDAGKDKGSGYAGRKIDADEYNPGAPAHAGDSQVTAVTKSYGSILLKQTKLKKRSPPLKPGRLSWSQLERRLVEKPSSKKPAESTPTSRESGALLLDSSKSK